MITDTSHNRLETGTRCYTGDYLTYYDAAAVDQHMVQHFASDPLNAFLSGEQIRSAWKNTDVEKAIVRINDHPFFVKRYHCLGPVYRIKNMYRKSKALKAFQNGQKFINAGISTPCPIFCLEQRHFKLLGESYLVCEFLDNAHNLLEIWPDLDDQTCMRLLHLAGTEIGHMHLKGFLHGDLNWRNILVQNKLGEESVLLVDLDGSRYARHIDIKSALRDLSHFYRDLERKNAPPQYIDLFTHSWRLAFE